MWRITHNIWLYTHSFERCPAYTAPPEEVLAEGWAGQSGGFSGHGLAKRFRRQHAQTPHYGGRWWRQQRG